MKIMSSPPVDRSEDEGLVDMRCHGATLPTGPDCYPIKDTKTEVSLAHGFNGLAPPEKAWQ